MSHFILLCCIFGIKIFIFILTLFVCYMGQPKKPPFSSFFPQAFLSDFFPSLLSGLDVF